MEYLFICLLQMADEFLFIRIVLFFASLVFAGMLIYFILKEHEALIDEYKYRYSCVDKYQKVIEENKRFKKLAKRGLIISCVLYFILAIVPEKQTLLLLGGTYYGKKAVKTVITDEKIKKIDTIINLELDKRIKELEKKGVLK